MEAAVIDTLRYARRLREAGMAPEQAEAMADAISGELVHNLVTRADLDAGLAGLRSEISAEMAALEDRLTWRLLGGVTVIVGLAVALIELG